MGFPAILSNNLFFPKRLLQPEAITTKPKCFIVSSFPIPTQNHLLFPKKLLSFKKSSYPLKKLSSLYEFSLQAGTFFSGIQKHLQTFLYRARTLLLFSWKTKASASYPGRKDPTFPKKLPPESVAKQKASSKVRGARL